MVVIKRIGIMSFAKLLASLFAIAGFAFGIVYSVGGFFIDLLATGLNQGTALAFFALIGMPAIVGTVGFVSGIVGAILYNLTIAQFGGMDVEFKK